jgi:hypothetical protein
MVGIITLKTKGKTKERPKDMQPARTKEGRKLFPLGEGSYLTHNPSNVTCMQILRCNNNRRFRTNISPTNTIFLSIVQVKKTLKSNINMLPEKLNAKRQE